MRIRAAAIRSALALGLAAVMLLVWNLSTVVSLGKPYAISLIPALDVQPVYGADDTFSYPRLGISAPISDQPQTSPLVTSDWSVIRQDLLKGTALSYDGSSFDQASLAFLTGHSSDTYPHPYSSVFAGLGEARVGDEVTLTVKDTIYHYKIMSEQVLDPNQPAEFEALKPGDPNAHYLALVTCWPVFTSSKRLVLLGSRM